MIGVKAVGNRRKYAFTEREAYEYCMSYEPSRNYLSKLNSVRFDKAMNLRHFLQWAGLNPVELLKLKSSFDSLEAERLLDNFVTSDVALPEGTKWGAMTCVRGFFRVNYRALQPQAGRMEYTAKKTQRCPSKNQRFSLYKAAYTPRDKAIVLVATCSAIAIETLSKLRFELFEEDWMRQDTPHISIPPELLKGHGKGKYKGVRQETFITPEAKKALIEYREWYSKNFNHFWSPEDHVFLCIKRSKTEPMDKDALGLLVMAIAERANTRFSVHDGRRILNTALQNVECDPNWIQMAMGRKVPGNKSPYTHPDIEKLRRKYQEALGELEFLGAGFVSDSGFKLPSVQQMEVIETMNELWKDGDFRGLALDYLRSKAEKK